MIDILQYLSPQTHWRTNNKNYRGQMYPDAFNMQTSKTWDLGNNPNKIYINKNKKKLKKIKLIKNKNFLKLKKAKRSKLKRNK